MMTRTVPFRLTAAFAAFVALGGIALAQHSHGSHGAKPTAGTETPATAAYKAAMDKMHKDMAIPYTGDADADFVRGMIPHHQGAIDMAKVMLAQGKDPALKALATSIIADQEREIATMREWLKKTGK